MSATPNLPCGDDFNISSRDGLRIWSNNINTLSLSNDMASFRELCDRLNTHNVDVIALQEINLDTTQYQVTQKILRILKETFGAVKLVTASTPVQKDTTWKPGGVLLAVVGSCSHRVTSTQRDPIGRWCSITLACRNKQSIRIYSAYQCVDVRHSGENTYYTQLWRLLRDTGERFPIPRKRFISDLRAELISVQRADTTFIVLGDFNETIGTDPDLMASICSSIGLSEAVEHLHPAAENIPTYNRGRRRLDYCLVSHSLLPAIAAAGLNQFHEISSSDHRALFLDLHMGQLFRLATPIVSPSLRHINSDSASAQRFVDLAYDHLIHNDTFNKYSNFAQHVNSTQNPHVLANSIDDQITKSLLSAEKKIARPPRPPWSEKLHKASLQVRLWKIAKSGNLNELDITTQLENAASDAKFYDPIPTGFDDINFRLKEAQRTLNEIRRNAADERQAFLQTLKERTALRKTPKDTEAHKALKCIERQIHSRQQFHKIRYALDPPNHQTLTKILVTKTEVYVNPRSGGHLERETTALVDTRAELEAAILSRNQKHFAKAKGTPFTVLPLTHLGSHQDFDMQQTPDDDPLTLPPGSFSETATVMTILNEASLHPPPHWPAAITFDDFIKGFLKWKESTSTSPSGRHLGIYKTLVTVYLNSSGEFDAVDDGSQATKYKAEGILGLIYGLATTAARLGFYLQRWTKVINVMIYKEPGNFNLDKLRVIHLFEADFNLTVGILFGRRAMYHARDNDLLHDGQGGRLGSECMDVTFTKVLHITMSHLTKTPLGIFESDAEACFDRIVMLMAFMSFKSLGAPSKPLQMWEQTLCHVRHSLRTGFGESENYYDYSEATPIIGPGQGSRGGVAAVCVMTTILLRAFERLGHGSTFCDPTQTFLYKAISKMFIDDASNYVNKFLRWLHLPADQEDVTELLQTDAQIWERLLHTSGGKLRPDKCLYYILHWMFDDKGRATPSSPDDDLQLTLSTGTSATSHTIKHVPPQTAHKTLGVHLSTTFQTTTALQQLQTKVLHYSCRLLKSNLSPPETWTGYFACFLPKLCYGLSVMTHQHKDLYRLQKPAIAATLVKLGFRRSINRSIVFGSPHYGGIGLRDLSLEQGISQIQLFMRHLRAQSQQGQLLQISLSWWQLQSGVPHSLLRFPQHPMKYLPYTWLTSIRDFLRRIEGSLIIADHTPSVPKPTRAADTHLMSAILALPNLSNANIWAFNRVRLYLGVALLSEVTTADGRHLTIETWLGTRLRHSPFLWPCQSPPGAMSFQTWRRLLGRAFLRGRAPRVNNKRPHLFLTNPLGPWLPGSQWLQSKWTTFYDRAGSRLYWQDEMEVHRFSSHSLSPSNRLRNPTFNITPDATLVSLPSSTIPVDAVSHSDHIRFASISHLLPTIDPGQQPQIQRDTFHQYIGHLPRWDYLLLRDFRFGNTSTDQILTLLQNPEIELILSSDGGAKDRLGSFGALIASQKDEHHSTNTILVEVGGIACGDTPRSFRAESYGQLASLRLLYHLTVFFDVTARCRFRFLLDNLGRLTRTRRFLRHPRPPPRTFLTADFDLDMQITDTLNHLDIRTRDEHIASHQEEPPPPEDPLWWKVQLNSRCDAIATDHLRRQTHPILSVPFLPASRVVLEVQRRTITSKLPSQLRHIGGSSFLYTNHKSQVDHLCRIHNWQVAQFHSVDWMLYDSVSNKKSSFPNRLFQIRWANHVLPLYHRQFRFQLSASAGCPSTCGCLDETDTHLLRCPHPTRKRIHSALLLELRSTYDSHSADPWLRQLLSSILASFDPSIPYNLTPLTAPYTALAQAQSSLGPDALFYGFFHRSWVVLQDAYLRTLGLPNERNQARLLVEKWAHLFQKATRSQWAVRNGHLHDSNTHAPSYARTLLLAEARNIYSLSDRLLFHDRMAVYQSISLEDRLAFATSRLKRWIKHVTPILKISIRQANERPPGNLDIRDFFTLPRPPEGTAL
jgi:endonuclease/exonuclease/phosphatase family metal-dependent hydrolase